MTLARVASVAGYVAMPLCHTFPMSPYAALYCLMFYSSSEKHNRLSGSALRVCDCARVMRISLALCRPVALRCALKLKPNKVKSDIMKSNCLKPCLPCVARHQTPCLLRYCSLARWGVGVGFHVPLVSGPTPAILCPPFHLFAASRLTSGLLRPFIGPTGHPVRAIKAVLAT